MKNKKQDVNSLEDLLKAADEFRKWAVDFGNKLSKVLADIQTSKKEEDTWEMEIPYEDGDEYYYIQSNGDIFSDDWYGTEADDRYFSQGNIFPTEQAAELEVKRRNLLTRFRAFRDECNGYWKINWKDAEQAKYIIKSNNEGDLYVVTYWTVNEFHFFGYFKNYKDAQCAIELFGDEIKELFVEGDA
ncbi:hypothetical protein HMPREF3103_04710 [Granulicatella sp. HMSC30F09]|uniref:hypothetical protein n=1 Tax=Granulicatella sp. HMSC30F09 TaxID=1581071 RepID=UPI0008A14EE5|nr:hypothetical protein [Granulicatella sp. HMSC30F09]OFT80111.1 hypothetical protein HMPREF3103_04710 [Granulicatella sp. HMSC30F09]